MRSSPHLTKIVVLANLAVMVAAVVVLLVLRTATVTPATPLSGKVTSAPSGSAAPAPSPEPDLPSADLPPPIPATVEFARQVKANEAGLVPVLMYHRIVKKRLASIDRTPSQVRQELEKLAKNDYVPITAREFVTGKIDIPAGKHPVVLTFDDGHSGHFALEADGMPAKDTAVGIIYQVARKYPGFRPVATFWVNRRPFGLEGLGDQKRAVRWLTSHGFEVANHTWTHPSLPSLSKKKIAEQIVKMERLLKKLGNGPSETLALPFGAMPRKKSTVQSGKWDGSRFAFKGVFLAGAEPSLSPFVKGFDWRAIQRIQSNGKKGECRKWCSQYWLEWLNKHPGDRYTADGDPEHISIPQGLRGNIRSQRRQQINAY
ncbi:Polysaccharide deacetylase [Streptosporangium subroseum]|uniref:Polysaccharide deacetylase n=1 Tax=Streptosporangium subroseum TaxID=106412 RepID=A0A239BPR8_9ACTN|nr:polysaccharide deacetylase family protein [Streptosporangium subroseum]SNS10087.1 Polysaccharide deacetylase [Streptosporangium subroseum]